MWYALAAVLAAISLARGEQASRTTLRLRIADAHGDSVALLRLTLEDADGTSHTVITDAAGQAVVGPLPGTIVFVRAAQLTQRQDLTVEPTTAREGLRLGLIPGQERTVRLIADGGLLFLDPEEVFSGADLGARDPSGAPLPASAPSVAAPPTPAALPSSAAAASVMFPPSAAAEPTTAGSGTIASGSTITAPTGRPTAASAGLRTARAPAHPLIVSLVAVAASTIVVLIGIIVGRRQP